MSWLPLGCVMLATACLNIKPFQGGDAGPGDGTRADAPLGILGDVSIVMDGDGAIATGPGYVMHFAQAAPHYPDSLMVNGHEVLATDTGCGRASKMGVNVYPADRSDAPSATDTGMLAIEIHGTTVARLNIAWNAHLAPCGTAAVTSSFTFFPDGRITRFDNVGRSEVAGTCACGPSTSAETLSETLYARDVSQFIYGPGTSSPIPSPMGGTNVTDTTCLSVPEFGFNLFLADGLGPNAELYSTLAGDVGVVYNTTGNPYAESFILPLPASVSCSDAITANLGYAFPPLWSVNGGATNEDVFDGIAGGASPSGAGFGVPTNGPTATLRIVDSTSIDNRRPNSTPPGYAFGLLFDQPDTQFTATKNGLVLDSDHVRFQSFPQNRKQVVVWIRDPVTLTDVIAVTASP